MVSRSLIGFPLIFQTMNVSALLCLAGVCLSLAEAGSDNLHGAIDTYIVQTELGNIRGYSKLVMGRWRSKHTLQRIHEVFYKGSCTFSLASPTPSLRQGEGASGSQFP